MKLSNMKHVAVSLAMLGTCLAVQAQTADLSKLGSTLTPIGAEKAGNAAGTIPAWNGGLSKPPAGFDPAKGYLDPFAADKPVLTITAANMEQHKDKLAPGQGVAWSRLVDLMGVFWADIALRVAARHRAGRLKQWLNYLRRHYPEAQQAFDTLRLVHDPKVMEAWLQQSPLGMTVPSHHSSPVMQVIPAVAAAI